MTPAAPRRGKVRDPLGPSRSSPLKVAANWAVTLGIVVLVGMLFIRNAGDLEAVGHSLAGVSGLAIGVLIAITAILQLSFAAEYAAALPGLGITRGLVCFEGQTAVSNLIPGPSGTATRLMVLRSWGFSLDDFTRLWLITSAVTNMLVLCLPAVSVIFLAIDTHPPEAVVWALAGVGVLVALIAAVIVVVALRSERLAARIGTISGRAIAWARGVLHRSASDEDFAAAMLRLRTGLIEGWHACGIRVTLSCLVNYLSQGALLLISVRAVGIDNDAAALGGVIVVYVMYRLLTIVEITPGGVGISEAILSGGLLAVMGGQATPQIAAAIVLFRGLTYAAPILLGGISLLVWRFARGWRSEPPAEDAGQAAVVGVLADREPPVG